MCTVIDSLQGYIHHTCDGKTKDEWLFRGMSSKNYHLIPKVGRKAEFIEHEFDMLIKFMDKGTAHSSYLASVNVIETDKVSYQTLALAQHHGLPTRLLDWTTNPLVALFFACTGNPEEDAVIYVANSAQFNDQVEGSPVDCMDVALYRPPHISPRITEQEGLFTVHPSGQLDIPLDSLKNEEGELFAFEKLLIPAKNKEKCLVSLDKLGVNQEKLFPGLDGISAYLQWKYSSVEVAQQINKETA